MYFTKRNKRLTGTDENALKKDLTLAVIKLKVRRRIIGRMVEENLYAVGIAIRKKTTETEKGGILLRKKYKLPLARKRYSKTRKEVRTFYNSIKGKELKRRVC